jgi:hypothetical protein
MASVMTVTRSLTLALGLAAGAAAQPAPDFRLLDVNAGSVRYGAQVSPRDYVLQVSGYYFGVASS